MKAFGIEIRKQGNVHGLFADVDLVLRRNNIPAGGVSAEMQRGTVAHALQKMMQPDKWFDVCTIDSAANCCGLVIPGERYKVYRAIHCVHWRDMETEYRQLITAMVLDDFRSILNP